MKFTNMNIMDFINHIITFDNVDNVDDILENCNTQSKKGFIFERLFDIIIKFGFCSLFTNSNFNHLIGNSNNGKLKILENINQYLLDLLEGLGVVFGSKLDFTVFYHKTTIIVLDNKSWYTYDVTKQDQLDELCCDLADNRECCDLADNRECCDLADNRECYNLANN